MEEEIHYVTRESADLKRRWQEPESLSERKWRQAMGEFNQLRAAFHKQLEDQMKEAVSNKT